MGCHFSAERTKKTFIILWSAAFYALRILIAAPAALALKGILGDCKVVRHGVPP
jgi:hypothetical protein